MPGELVERVEAIFHEALEQESGLRTAFVRGACGRDEGLRRHVESLLALHMERSDWQDPFLEKPAWTLFLGDNDERKASLAKQEADPDLPFERLGEFSLIRKLAGGGMGTVYLALQESLYRQVALKVIHKEHLGSMELALRFEREIDARTDIYALGVILYEALTDEVPFKGTKTEQIFHQILETEPSPPRRINPSLARDVEIVVLKAMEKSPTTVIIAWMISPRTSGDCAAAR